MGSSITTAAEEDSRSSRIDKMHTRGRHTCARAQNFTRLPDRSLPEYEHEHSHRLSNAGRHRTRHRVRFQDDRVRSLLLSAEVLRRLGYDYVRTSFIRFSHRDGSLGSRYKLLIHALIGRYSELIHKETCCDSQHASERHYGTSAAGGGSTLSKPSRMPSYLIDK